jgi:hypothetical protein
MNLTTLTSISFNFPFLALEKPFLCYERLIIHLSAAAIPHIIFMMLNFLTAAQLFVFSDSLITISLKFES